MNPLRNDTSSAVRMRTPRKGTFVQQEAEEGVIQGLVCVGVVSGHENLREAKRSKYNE